VFQIFILTLQPRKPIVIMNETKRIYKKELVRLQYVDKADGRKSIRLVTYLNGKRTSERIPDLYLLPEDSAANIKKNQATIRMAKKICKERLKEVKSQNETAGISPKHVAKVELPHKTTLYEWLDRYTEIQRSRGVRALSTVIRCVPFIRQYHEDLPLADVDKKFCLGFIDFIRDYKSTRTCKPFSPKTCSEILKSFHAALNTAIQAGEIETNPINRIESSDKFKPTEKVREYLTIEELQKFIDTPCKDQTVKRAFLFACYCGLRRSDILNLTWKDITREGKITYVTVRMEKTEDIVRIPLPEQALLWLPKKPKRATSNSKVFAGLTSSRIEGSMHQWTKSVGLTNKTVTFHTSRHTYATLLLTLGADIYTVSKLLGHTSIRMTQRYAQIVDQKKDDAIDKLNNL
jgi:integrase